MAEERICKKCGAKMHLIHSKDGKFKDFYGCENYKNGCKYTEPAEGEKIKCEKCGEECYIFEYKDKKTGKTKKAYVCPKCDNKNWDVQQ